MIFRFVRSGRRLFTFKYLYSLLKEEYEIRNFIHLFIYICKKINWP